MVRCDKRQYPFVTFLLLCKCQLSRGKVDPWQRPFYDMQICHDLSFWICQSIKALKGQTTTKMAAFGYSKPWSCKYAQTLGTSWKIKDFPHPVGSNANTFSRLTKWSRASSWTCFNSKISKNPVSKTYCTAPRNARSLSLGKVWH